MSPISLRAAAIAFALGLALAASALRHRGAALYAAAAPSAPSAPPTTTSDDIAAVKAELAHLNCMACHKAASKEFIRVHVAERRDAGVVDFRPEE